MSNFIIGIDEAGRGPLAGPVAVGIVAVPPSFNWDNILGVGDSKKISAKNRELIYKEAIRLAATKKIFCTVEMGSAAIIDKRGIAVVIRELIEKGLTTISKEAGFLPSEVTVLLDGSLVAPGEYCTQKTIIKGDATEKVIGLASILAKVTRDTYMEKLSECEVYKHYYFAKHKGYGTALHRRKIAEQGF